MTTRKEFRDWQDNPVTKHVFEVLKENRQYHNDLLLNAVPNYQSKENCLMTIGKLTGAINAMNSIIELNYEVIEPDGETEDE